MTFLVIHKVKILYGPFAILCGCIIQRFFDTLGKTESNTHFLSYITLLAISLYLTHSRIELSLKAPARPYSRKFYFHQNEECFFFFFFFFFLRGGGGRIMKNACQFDNLFEFCQLSWISRIQCDCKHFMIILNKVHNFSV